MRKWIVAVVCAAGLSSVGIVNSAGRAQSQQANRHAGAHVHGHGSFNIAVEGSTLELELAAPGSDIVGFEHAATTAAQTAAVATAKATLSKPAMVFKLPPDAQCKATRTVVTIKNGGAGQGQATHSEFHATYSFRCTNPGRLKVIEFVYFKSFARAIELDVNVVSPKGQSTFEVTRDKPQLDLRRLM